MSAVRRLFIDAVLLVALIAAYYPATTGIALHEWLSVVVIAPVLLHMVVNWDWVVRVVERLGRRLRSGTWINFVVDTLLFLATVTVMLSGLMVSQVVAAALDLPTNPALVWHSVHSLSADATIALAAVHLALHWRWIERVVRVRVLGQRRTMAGGAA